MGNDKYVITNQIITNCLGSIKGADKDEKEYHLDKMTNEIIYNKIPTDIMITFISNLKKEIDMENGNIEHKKLLFEIITTLKYIMVQLQDE